MQGFIFDLNSLARVDKLWAAAQRETTEAFGGIWSHELAALLDGQALTTMITLLADAANVPEADQRELQRSLLVSFDRLVHAGELRVHDGALPLLKGLRDHAVPIAVISTMPLAMHCIGHTNLQHYVRRVDCYDPGLWSKPSPSAHRAAIDRASIDPRRSVAIEHRATGVRAAQAAGLFTLADPAVTDAIGAHGQLQSYWHRDVAAILKAAALPRATSTAIAIGQ